MTEVGPGKSGSLGCPLLEGSAEMTRAGGSGCLLAREPHCRLFLNIWGLPGDQRTPWFPLQNMALPQAQTEPAWGGSWPKVLWALWSFSLGSEGPGAKLFHPLHAGSPHRKRLVRAAGSALVTHTACAGSGPAKGIGVFFSSRLPSSAVYTCKINRT